jgi:hypothetical protein
MSKKANMSKRVSAENKNKKAFKEALDGVSSLIGRVEKNLGNSAFQINLGGGRLVQGLIRGVFKGGKSSEAFVSPGIFVILAASSGLSKVHEIVGVINRKKDLKELREKNCIHSSLCDTSMTDDIFDYDGLDHTMDIDEDNKKAYERISSKYTKSNKDTTLVTVESSDTQKTSASSVAAKKINVYVDTHSVSLLDNDIRPSVLQLPPTVESWDDIDIDAI